MKLPKIFILLFLAAATLVAWLPAANAINLVIINNNGGTNSGPFRLVSSLPGNWQSVDAPGSVTLMFSQPARPDKSFIKLFNLNGDQLDTGPLEAQGNNLSVTVNGLTTGKYTAKWRARCQCDDPGEIGDTLRFTVR